MQMRVINGEIVTTYRINSARPRERSSSQPVDKPISRLYKPSIVSPPRPEKVVEDKGLPTRDCNVLSRKSTRSLISLRNKVNDILDHRYSRELAKQRASSSVSKETSVEDTEDKPPNRAARRLAQFTAEANSAIRARLPRSPKKADYFKVLAEAFKDPFTRKYANFRYNPSEFLPVAKATIEVWQSEVPQVVDPDGEYTVDYTHPTRVSVRVKLRMMKPFVVRPARELYFPGQTSPDVIQANVPTSHPDYQMDWPCQNLPDRPHRRLRSESDILEAVSQKYFLLLWGDVRLFASGPRPPDPSGPSC
jgi:hypothetical protein